MVADLSSVDAVVDQALFSAPGSPEVTRLSALETVRARILLSVDHGLLPPGSKLPGVDSIAAGLEVSTITARRALESLVADGVLVRRPGRGGGTFVSHAVPELQDSAVRAFRADDHAIRRLIDQRILTESAIVHEAALRATPAQCDELDRLIGESQAAASWMEHHVPDARFHHLIAEISDLPEVPAYLAIYEALTGYFVPYPQEQLETGRDEHRAIVAALRSHDSNAAVSITRTHVGSLRHEMFMGLAG